MHSEYYAVSKQAADVINKAKAEGGRVICVGTTSVRTLESAADDEGKLAECSGDTDIFIYPPYRFKAVDCLITNFHLPESTLIIVGVCVMQQGRNTFRLQKRQWKKSIGFSHSETQ